LSTRPTLFSFLLVLDYPTNPTKQRRIEYAAVTENPACKVAVA